MRSESIRIVTGIQPQKPQKTCGNCKHFKNEFRLPYYLFPTVCSFLRELLLSSVHFFSLFFSRLPLLFRANENEKLRLQLSSLVWGLVIGSGKMIGRARQGSAISCIIETTYFWSATFLIFTNRRNFECKKQNTPDVDGSRFRSGLSDGHSIQQ